MGKGERVFCNRERLEVAESVVKMPKRSGKYGRKGKKTTFSLSKKREENDKGANLINTHY